MSWVKRRGEPSSTSEGRTGVPFYNPNQHITPQPLQQQPFQNTTGSHSTQSQYPPANWYNPTQQITHQANYQLNQGISQQQHQAGPYWQDQSHAYNQPPPQSTPFNSNLLPQGNNSNANQFMNSYHQQPQQQQQPTENQQYYQNSNLTNIVQPLPNQNFFQPQQNYQNSGTHYYPNNQRTPIPSNTENLPDQNFVSNQGNMNSDPWNWGWGDESSGGATQTNMSKNDNTISQSFSNIEDSFAVHDDSWNWTIDDSNSSSSASNSYNKTDQKQKNTLQTSNKSDGFKNVALQQQSEFKKEQAQQSIVFEKISPEAAAKLRVSSQQYPTEENDMKNETAREETVNNNSPQQIQSNVVGTAGQRTQSDTLTPQWSIESQVSQDSSDDPLQTTSESDNKSNKLSRSSTTSQCPSLPNTHEYEIQHNHPYETYSEEKHTQQELTYPGYHQNQYTEESIQSQISEVSHAIENLVLQQENKEIVAPEVSNFENIDSNNQFTQPSKNAPSSSALQDLSSPPLMSYKNSIPLHKNETNSQMPPKNVTPPLMPPKNAPSPILPPKNVTPPLMPLKNTTPPLLPPAKNTASTSAASSDVAPPSIPPKNNLEGPNNVNPYKRVSNKNTVQVSRSANQVYATRNLNSQDNLNNQNFMSGLNQVPENRSHLEVNLETVPDNVERPDQIPSDLLRQNNSRKINTLSHTQQWPPVENLEVAPKNDRNQYLETGQLSDSDLPDYQQNDFSVETNTEEPPPGLRRMVLGRTENESILPGNVSSEPRILTGLDRVVDGQPENVINSQNIISISHSTSERNDELPVGLHRMVPGESSSPESNNRWINNTQNNFFRSTNFDDDDTEAELQNIENNISMLPSQRSETIGADTPPSLLSQTGDSGINRNSAVGRDSTTPDIRETNVDGADTQSDSAPPTSSDVPTRIVHQKNESISAQSTIRSQTDGENTTDNALGPNKESSTGRGRPRTDSSEDDREVRESSIDRRRNKSPGRYDKDRKYYDRRERESPDRYWDRKSDRRRKDRDRYYDDETDYYSDKDRRDRRPRDTRSRDEYESLRMSNNSRQRGTDYYRTYHGSRREVERGDKPRGDRERDRMSRNDYERDPRRDDYYYGRYDDDYYGRESRSSRPSSRSESNYRDRMDPRDPRKVRDFYSPYYQGYGYDSSNPYYAVQYQQYQYYENLRRTNPTAYAEWYRKYMQSVGHLATNSLNDSQVYRSHDDKASVHSGRSSTNDELRKERYASHRFYSGCSSEVPPHMSGYYSQPHTTHSYSQDDSRMLDHTDSSLNLEDTQTSLQRLTPAKFSTAHVKANISSGHFVRILPHYPIDGQPPIVELLDLQQLLANDPEQQELLEFPGPLIKGVTHKKTLIEYCDNKIKKALCGPAFNDRESYILMWELLILLLRQNGVVVGTDIAELLMKNSTSTPAPVVHSRRASVASSISSLPEEMPSCDGTRDDNTTASISHTKSTLNEAYITDKFREYLIYGSGKEALEWAMKHGLWGHALFLASKLDKRTYANVLMRFANGLTFNDPLQTLYQLLSGRLPAAVTCVSDEKWGDWKPHLAMILSNTSQRIDLDRKAITTLGDTLLSRGSIYAAHFCYLMAQTGFGDYGSKSGRLVLLGSSHQKPFKEFATNEAIIMTEIYEYACSLNDTTFNIPEFQIYKYLMANRLAERGFLERALLYTERVGLIIAQNPTRYSPNLANQIVNLAERLRSRDPAALADLQLDPNDSDGENNVPSSIAWISNLKSILSDYDMGLLTQEVRSMSNLASSELDIVNSITPPTDQSQQQTLTAPNLVPEQQTYDQQSWVQQQPTIPQQILQHDSQQQQQQQQQFYQPDFSQQHQHQQQSSWPGDQYSTQQQQWQQQSEQQQQHTIAANQTTQQSISGGGFDYEPQQDQQNQYWNQQQWGADNHMNLQNDVQQNKDNTYWGATDKNEPEPNVEEKSTNDDVAAMQMPQITMPNSASSYDYDDEDRMQTVQSTQTAQNQKNSQTKAVSNQKKDNKHTNNSGGSGWFGGIWNKLSLRPKNQMILPDDKNPTIVWDPEKKKWVNLDEDGSNEESNNVRPPPKMSDLMPAALPPPTITQKIPQPNNENKIPNHQNMSPFPTTNHTTTNSTYNNNNDINVNANDNTKNVPPVPNMFKMQRGRGLKKAYVDVFNPGGTKAPSSLPPASVLGMNPIPQANTQLNYFVPASTNDPNAPVDFISNPSGGDLSAEQDNSQMNGPGPLMYNPNQFSN